MYSITRGQFLRGMVGAGALAAVGAKATEEAPTIVRASVGALELAESLSLSYRAEQSPVLTDIRFETLHRTEAFSVARTSIEYSDRTVSPVFAFLGVGSVAFEEAPEHKRELVRTQGSTALVLPVGYLVGNYRRNAVDKEVDFKYCARTTAGNYYGPKEITDRFPGLSESYNCASGGIALQEGMITLVDKDGLASAMASDEPFAQMSLYIDRANKEVVLNADWTHFGNKLAIGRTAYYWSAYFEVVVKGEATKGCIVCDQDMIPLRYLATALENLSDNGEFKMVLADGGNGASMIVTDNGRDTAYGPNGFDTHLVPAVFVVS